MKWSLKISKENFWFVLILYFGRNRTISSVNLACIILFSIKQIFKGVKPLKVAYNLLDIIPRFPKSRKFPMSAKFPPMSELMELRGMERKGTVKVRPSWMSWELVAVTPRNLLAAPVLVCVV